MSYARLPTIKTWTVPLRDHLTSELVYAAPDWTLEQATDAMRRGGFRHLVVLEGGDVLGIISVRDVVAAWTPTRV